MAIKYKYPPPPPPPPTASLNHYSNTVMSRIYFSYGDKQKDLWGKYPWMMYHMGAANCSSSYLFGLD